jgi:formylglycine-generating enzyme required for sulfatase activity
VTRLLLAGIAGRLLPRVSYCAEPPKAGEERDFEIAKGVKMRFYWIPVGKATLGSQGTEDGRLDNEKEHDFTSDGFWLGKYEGTQGEYEAVMGENPSCFKLPKPAAGKLNMKPMGSDRFPVENVTWYECQELIKNCEVTGYKLKLPHEDEWEYACRGARGTSSPSTGQGIQRHSGEQLRREALRDDEERAVQGQDDSGRFVREGGATPGGCATCSATSRSGATTRGAWGSGSCAAASGTRERSVDPRAGSESTPTHHSNGAPSGM